MLQRGTVTVEVTNLWASPSAARRVDAAMLGDRPDVAAWLRAMDAASDPSGGRLGLEGRLLTQLCRGEPVEPTGPALDGWLPVRCPWQPSAGSGGYPGWVVAAQLSWDGAATSDSELPAGTRAGSLLEAAGRQLGVPYLWGGCCATAVDCSGLVHLAARALGLVVPRDAADQLDAAVPVPLDQTRPGDLPFFAHPGRRPHHVGIASGPGRMLHAPHTGAVVVEELLGADRRATLVAAGALPGPGGPKTSIGHSRLSR